MDKKHIEKIQSRGYWRVNFQPLSYQQKISLPGCREIVERNAVRLRGWDYPHIPRRHDDTHGLEAHGSFYQGWTDWAYYKELWRMYQSGQFLHYMGLREDWEDEATGLWANPNRKPLTPGSKLNIIGSVVYEFTEIYEFLSRLTKEGLYDEGVKVSISLVNTSGRDLWISDPMRMEFFSPHVAHADTIEYSKVYDKDILISDPHKESLEAMRYFFERFGWDNPSEEVLKSDQQALLKGLL